VIAFLAEAFFLGALVVFCLVAVAFFLAGCPAAVVEAANPPALLLLLLCLLPVRPF